VFQRAIAEDLGDLNMTAVVKLFDKERKPPDSDDQLAD
jgi:hypothetical protein